MSYFDANRFGRSPQFPKKRTVEFDFTESSELCVQWLQNRNSLLFRWGIRNAWQVALAMDACVESSKHSSDKEIKSVMDWMERSFLSSWSPANFWYWRGLSGSDDFAWAGILNINCAKRFPSKAEGFLDRVKSTNGARGAIQLYEEIQSHYVERDDSDPDVISVYWDAGLTYKAAISNSLFAYFSTQLYLVSEKTGVPNEKYLRNAKGTVNWLLNKSKLWQNGGIRDGLRDNGSFDSTFWTYNQGVILGALSDLFSITQDKWYLDSAVKIAKFVISFMTYPDATSGLLMEPRGPNVPRHQLTSSDQQSFKGIFTLYLARFIRDNATHLDEKDKIQFCDFITNRNALSVWLYSKATDKSGLETFAGMWRLQIPPSKDENTDGRSSTASLVSAFNLFNAATIVNSIAQNQ